MGGANWAILRTHVRVVGWLCRRYPDRNLGLDAIRPINWAKADKIGGQNRRTKSDFGPGRFVRF